MFEIELFICIKRDLALNNIHWSIYHKTKRSETKRSETKRNETKRNETLFAYFVMHLRASIEQQNSISTCDLKILLNHLLYHTPHWLVQYHFLSSNYLSCWLATIIWFMPAVKEIPIIVSVSFLKIKLWKSFNTFLSCIQREWMDGST